jgi:hypothetical protein
VRPGKGGEGARQGRILGASEQRVRRQSGEIDHGGSDTHVAQARERGFEQPARPRR